MLRPLVRWLIRSGVTFPVFADVVRGLYIDVARRDLALGERARTDSRISLLTGIHRKELRRQRQSPADAAEPQIVTVSSQILARWLGDPAFTEADGTPVRLRREQFDQLVDSITRDVRPRSVLDEWLAQGLVASDEAGALVLRAPGFLPRADAEARLFYLGRNLHDHIAGAVANVSSAGTPPFLDRSVHYDQLSPEAATSLEAVAREAAQAALIEVNRRAIAIADGDGDDNDGRAGQRRRVNFGIYVYSEDEPDGA